MRILALDIGTRRTGVAFLDIATGVPLPLDTIHHDSIEQLVTTIGTLINERRIDRIIIGLPLLPSGLEGSQARLVRDVAEKLRRDAIPIEFVDERYTTPRDPSVDGDAAAACQILLTKVAIDKIE